MQKAVIFDLDGTLLDTSKDICGYINFTMRHFGYREINESMLKTYIGNGARNLCARCIGESISEEKLDEVVAFYKNVYKNAENKFTVPFDGVLELISKLKDNGYKLAILTNKPQQNIDDLYKIHFARFNFDAVVGQSAGVKCKPDKTATLNILEKLNVLPENTYFIGDGETDVITSINAGTCGISALWGYRSKSRLEQAGATVFAENPYSVIKLLGL